MTDLSDNQLIEVQGVVQSYKVGTGILPVLKNVSFTIPRGSFTIIHGPSGSGKTTLLNVIAGLEKPDQGTVRYKDQNIYNLTPEELAHFRAKVLGVVHQANYWVQSLNVLENVALPLFFLGYNRENAEREALESLRRVGMDIHKDKLPTLLSGGEQQRVSMARALVSNPTYIVADEPTGNLDSKNGEIIMQLLKYFHEKLQRTIILVTHNQEYLPYGTQIIRLKDGAVAQIAPHEPPGTEQPRVYQAVSMAPITKSFKSAITALQPITLRILAHIAWQNLKFKRFRSGLTILGVVIGIGSIFLLLSFGLGLQNLVQKQIIGTDSVKVINVTRANSDVLQLNQKSIEQFEDLAFIDKIGTQYTSAAQFTLGSANSDGVAYGVDKDYLELSTMPIVRGRQINPANTQEALINQSMLTALGYDDASQAVGKQFDLTLNLDAGMRHLEQPLTIVGVTSYAGGPATYLSESIYQALGVEEYDQVKVVAMDQSYAPQIRQQIEAYGYETSSPLDTLEQVNRFFRFFNVILICFGGIGMTIAIIGMLNTLTIALLERTKEIGLMFTLGARRQDMRRLFIAESLLLSFIGGVIGISASMSFGFAIDLFLNHVTPAQGAVERFSLFSTPVWLIAALLVFILIVGYVVSYVPARRASHINPIDALRRE